MDISAIDLFCGAGGLSHGLVLEGINVCAGIDLDPVCKYPFEKNNSSEFICKDIKELSSNELEDLYPKNSIRVLAGCAPCQPFSTYMQGKIKGPDGRWGLLYSFGKLVKNIKPEIVTMENVPNLTKHKVFTDFVTELESCGYFVSFSPVKCLHYGVPQTRTRLVLLASLLGPISLEEGCSDPDKFLTVRHAIGNLLPLRAGESDPNDRIHRVQKLTDINQRRIRQSKPGGTWRDWSPDIVSNCHKDGRGSTYVSVYGRMVWDKPAPTMTTQCYNYGSGRFGHPEQDRAISLREAAIFQSFPPDYDFVPPDKPVNIRKVSTLVGNAVPVELGRAIARSVKEHIRSQKTPCLERAAK